MKHSDYKDYTAEQLLQDEFFVNSHLHPTPESIRFWEDAQRGNTSLSNEIVCAKTLLGSMSFYRQKEWTETAKNKVWGRIAQTNRRHIQWQHRRRTWAWISVAASLALLLAAGWLYSDISSGTTLSEIEKVQKPTAPVKSIQVILADKSELKIEGEDSHVQYDKQGKLSVNSRRMDTIPAQKPKEASAFNQLVVPAGKRSYLALSDGTNIWVNANTRVVYPVVFDEKKREIFVDGEIYLDVARDEQRPFVVKTSKLDVQVLGTSFNVAAYASDSDVSVVLVSGKVNVKTKDRRKTELSPNQMLRYVSGRTNTQTVDVDYYISWKEGVYRFDNEKFSVILGKLSKYYGQEIAYDEDVAHYLCSGTLDLRDDIKTVLKGLQSTVPVVFDLESENIKAYVKP